MPTSSKPATLRASQNQKEVLPGATLANEYSHALRDRYGRQSVEPGRAQLLYSNTRAPLDREEGRSTLWLAPDCKQAVTSRVASDTDSGECGTCAG